MATIKVLRVDCGHCAAHVEKALHGVEGVERVDIRLDEKIALVSFDQQKISREAIAAKIEDAGYDVE